MKTIQLTEQISLSSLHKLENPDLTDLENERLYGICFRKHGHDYHIQVLLEADIDDETGLAFDRLGLKILLEKNLFERFNGKFLNKEFDCTSGEALSLYFYKILKASIEGAFKGTRLLSVHIQETRKNWFSYTAAT